MQGLPRSRLRFVDMRFEKGMRHLLLPIAHHICNSILSPEKKGTASQGRPDGTKLRGCLLTGGLKATRSSAATRLLQATR